MCMQVYLEDQTSYCSVPSAEPGTQEVLSNGRYRLLFIVHRESYLLCAL